MADSKYEAQDADTPKGIETVYAKDGTVPVSVDSMYVDAKARAQAEEYAQDAKAQEVDARTNSGKVADAPADADDQGADSPDAE